MVNGIWIARVRNAVFMGRILAMRRTVTNMKEDRLISLNAAIDAIMCEPTDAHYPSWYAERLKHLPSAQQERKKGKWIYNSPVTMKCNQCGFVIKDWDWHRFKYCPNCIADMRGESDG